MRTVDLDDRLDNSLFYLLHTVQFFIEDSSCFLRVDRLKVIALPLYIHHNRQCSLCMPSLFRRYLMGFCNRQVSSRPETNIIRQCFSGAGHKVGDALDTGQFHIIADFFCILIFLDLFRCIACQKTFYHKL